MNKLYYGDNLDGMRKFIRPICVETADLCYIDQPFNSKHNYNQIYNKKSGPPRPRNAATPPQTSRGADRAQAQAFTDTWTWYDHANQCYEEILTNKNGVPPQQLSRLG